LAAALVERFGLDESHAEADVESFLADLRERNLLIG
jgi:hypothetical protein